MFTPALILMASTPHIGLSSFAAYIAVCAALPLIVFWRPEIGVYVLLPLMPLQTMRYQMQVLPFGDKIPDVLLLATFAGLLLHKSEVRLLPKKALHHYLLWICIFLYVMLCVGSYRLNLPWPIDASDDRFATWKNMIEMPLLYVAVVACIRTRTQMYFLLGLMMVAILRVDLGFFSTMSGRDLTHFENDLRYAGALGYAGQNGLAAFAVQCLVFVIALINAAKKWWLKVCLYMIAAATTYCVLLSFSRGAYLALIIGLVFLGIVQQRRYLVVVLVLLFTWQSALPTAVRERVLMTYDGNEVESSAQERLDLWQDALDIIPEHPVIGTGFDTYRLLGRNADYLDTHNYYVKVLVETGGIGLAAFLVLIMLMINEGVQLRLETGDRFFASLGVGFATLMVCVIVVNFFGDRWLYQQISAYTWAICGLVVSARRMVHAEQASASSPVPACLSGTGVRIEAVQAGAR